MPQKEMGSMPKKSNSKVIMILILVVLIIAAGALYFFVYRKGINKSDYQAIFLSNGQVYFGKVTNKNAGYVVMKDIYYLQLKQPLQEQTEQQQNSPDLILIKLGNELHGPMDRMEINRNHVLFIEDLKDDSKVVTAIMEYKASEQQ
ncbi:MAG: hypothetical protein ACOZBH_02375 [Patescibacteria group bacterium]